MSYLKVKDMCMPEHCINCPLLMLSSYGSHFCFVTESSLSEYEVAYEKPDDCPLEESED